MCGSHVTAPPHRLQFLLKFFETYPKFASHDFWITGEVRCTAGKCPVVLIHSLMHTG